MKLDQMLKAEQPLEVEDLKRLINELQHFSVETADQMERSQDKPEVTNIDPTRLPPARRSEGLMACRLLRPDCCRHRA